MKCLFFSLVLTFVLIMLNFNKSLLICSIAVGVDS